MGRMIICHRRIHRRWPIGRCRTNCRRRPITSRRPIRRHRPICGMVPFVSVEIFLSPSLKENPEYRSIFTYKTKNNCIFSFNLKW